MAADPAIEAPLYAQQKGASGKSDGWWCQLPHATQVPGGLVPLRRDSAPLPKNYDLDQTVYSSAGTAKDASITTHGPPTLIVEVKVNSAVAPGATARVPQFSSAQKVVLKKGVTANVLTDSGQTDVSWAFSTSGRAQIPERRLLRHSRRVRCAGLGGHRRGEACRTPLMADCKPARIPTRAGI